MEDFGRLARRLIVFFSSSVRLPVSQDIALKHDVVPFGGCCGISLVLRGRQGLLDVCDHDARRCARRGNQIAIARYAPRDHYLEPHAAWGCIGSLMSA